LASGAVVAQHPILTDEGNGGFPVFSATAAVLYLAERSGRLLPLEEPRRAVALQWLGWESMALGPLSRVAGAWRHPLRPRLTAGSARSALELLDRRLSRVPFLAETFGIVDLAVWPWARMYAANGAPCADLGHVTRWIAAIGERPSVQRALVRLREEHRSEACVLAGLA
jgi:GST-like protein